MTVLVRADIAAHIRVGRHDKEITANLGVSAQAVTAVRNQLGIPAVRARGSRPRTVDDAFWGTVRHLPDHLIWCGDVDHEGLPTFTYLQVYSARRYAYEQGYGRPPVGPPTPICGRGRCVDYEHLADEPTRYQLATVLNSLFGEPR
ncbi:hypothetical protein ACIQMP_08020 [Streptomyces sp. NPDC091385]|uniref:hypothetical protein n=1 Tax=Streptomyces sp. NPDC091385 TaxID=3365997 RepID=UPI00381E87EB